MTEITRKTTNPIAWSDIKEKVKNGEVATILSVGDEITETLKTGESVVFVVAGINTYHDNEVIISLKDCLNDRHYMNKDWTNKGGWGASAMRKYLNEEIFNNLPDDLQAIIAPREIQANNDKLWLFSEFEIFGENIWGDDQGDNPIPYYQTPANRVKLVGNDECADNWWERSPGASGSAGFCYVNSGGNANGTASNSIGVCFGFCI